MTRPALVGARRRCCHLPAGVEWATRLRYGNKHLTSATLLPPSCVVVRRRPACLSFEQPVVKKEEFYGNDEKGQSTELVCPMGKHASQFLRPTTAALTAGGMRASARYA